jgi:hypothetical protein
MSLFQGHGAAGEGVALKDRLNITGKLCLFPVRGSVTDITKGG